MVAIRKAGWMAVIALAAMGSQVPRLMSADVYANPFAKPTTAPAGSEFQMRNPDAHFAIAGDICSGLPLTALASQAISSDPEQRQSAINQLRDAGPAGLETLLDAHIPEVAMHRDGVTAPAASANDWQRLSTAIDGVAAQRDAYASGLYWYTDLASAEAAARSTGKPILSLRLLGNLNDEFSCANSRFFRTVLYANAELSKHLREHFILHWQSVRPVPVITIDFGDGRKIRRTITGNSIHYVLTADGEVVDGIPGLYGPKAFLRQLNDAETAFNSVVQRTGQERSDLLAQYHSQQCAAISDAFADDLHHAGIVLPAIAASPVTGGPNPPAAVAGRRAASKGLLELTVVKAVTAGPSPVVDSAGQLSDADWLKIADLHARDAALDAGSKALIAAKNPPNAAAAARVTASKTVVETPLIRVVRNFQYSIAQDTVRNEYLYHLQIHRWLSSTPAAADDVAALNKRVYAELFLTPDSDPWLGLVPADTYSALDDDGVCH